MKNFNTGIALRWNKLLRSVFINPVNRRRLKNRDFSLLCNNCTGGVICHDLGLQFKSPTVNLFFYADHFFRFCENFDYYIGQPLVLCEEPMHKPVRNYPVCNLGDLELHFMHYASFEEAKQKWDSRKARLNRDNMFVMWTFVDEADPVLAARFQNLPFKNKVAFTEKAFPEHPDLFTIKGTSEGLMNYTGLLGRRGIDRFDIVSWFNKGK